MSHFAFGVIEGVRDATRRSIGMGMEVRWGKGHLQSVMTEMLEQHGLPPPGDTPYCLAAVDDDNADALISPYQVKRDTIVEHLGFMLNWLDSERKGKRAELWVTEGYDDGFEELQGSREELQELVRGAMARASDLPSLRIRLVSTR